MNAAFRSDGGDSMGSEQAEGLGVVVTLLSSPEAHSCVPFRILLEKGMMGYDLHTCTEFTKYRYYTRRDEMMITQSRNSSSRIPDTNPVKRAA